MNEEAHKIFDEALQIAQKIDKNPDMDSSISYRDIAIAIFDAGDVEWSLQIAEKISTDWYKPLLDYFLESMINQGDIDLCCKDR